jgi:signal transduction histidine kinase/ActR/RegA family two-component response regulator
VIATAVVALGASAAFGQSHDPARPPLIVGVETDYPPYAFFDAEGQPSGFNVDLAKAVGRVMGRKVEVRMAPWSQVRAALENREIDAIVGMYFSAERDKLVDFSPPFAVVHHSAFRRAGSGTRVTADDLRGKRLAVMRGDIMHDWAVENGLDAELLLVDSQAAALRCLAAAECDYALAAQLPGLYWVQELELSNVAVVVEPLRSLEYCFATQEGDQALASQMGEGLAILRQTGEYQRIYDEWLGVLKTASAAPRWVWYAAYGLIPLLGATTLMALWSWTLRKTVNKRTRALREEIAERKRVAVELGHAKSQAEAANLSKSEFLANMSHEIRTPLTAILGFTDVLLERDAPSNAEEHETLQTIKRNSESLLRLVNDILDLSKVESGQLYVERQAYSPCKLVAEVLSAGRVLSDAKGLALRVDFLTEVPRTIATDAPRLRQILLNLVSNAVKFTETGEVRIEVRLEQDDQPRLMFDVVDTGIGMDAAALEQIFEPFMQGDTSTTRKYGGTGLGLAISRRLAERLGGQLTVEGSALGQGSRFRLTLGVEPEDLAALEHQPSEAILFRRPGSDNRAGRATDKPLADLRILLVEDGPDNQRLIKHLLTRAGATVDVVENGALALDAINAEPVAGPKYDLILMDMQMPVMDGYEATRRLRAQGESRPIVALTAHAMSDDRDRCLAAGCSEFATKPIKRTELFETIRAETVRASAGPALR